MLNIFLFNHIPVRIQLNFVGVFYRWQIGQLRSWRFGVGPLFALLIFFETSMDDILAYTFEILLTRKVRVGCPKIYKCVMVSVSKKKHWSWIFVSHMFLFSLHEGFGWDFFQFPNGWMIFPFGLPYSFSICHVVVASVIKSLDGSAIWGNRIHEREWGQCNVHPSSFTVLSILNF